VHPTIHLIVQRINQYIGLCDVLIIAAQSSVLVYGITNKDDSGYNRKSGVLLNTKSKVEGAITNEE